MKIILTESQFKLLLSESPKDPVVYTDPKKYEYALKIWEDKTNLRKAYLFQKEKQKNTKKTQIPKGIIMNLSPQEIKNYWNERESYSSPYRSIEQYEKNLPGENHKLIYDYYKSLKFNFPVHIQWNESLDLVHSIIFPKQTYFDGKAWSPVYEDPGPKPILKVKDTPKNIDVKQPPPLGDSLFYYRLPDGRGYLMGSMIGPKFRKYLPSDKYYEHTPDWLKNLLNNDIELDKYLKKEIGPYYQGILKW